MKNLFVVSLLFSLIASSQTPKQVVAAGLLELNIETNYHVQKMTKRTFKDRNNKYTVYAEVKKVGDDHYMIRLADMKYDKLVHFIAHELIHLQQYRSGQLKTRGKQVMYKGQYYKDASKLETGQRAWELDATRESLALERQIKKRLNIDYSLTSKY